MWSRATLPPDPKTLFPLGRAAVHHRALRAGPRRVGGRREPLDRRREGAAHHRPRALQGGVETAGPQDHAALLRQCLKYIRNLSLLERRLTPDLYTIVTAAKQTAGDRYALHVAETARAYPYAGQAAVSRRSAWGRSRLAFPTATSCAWSAACPARRSSGEAWSCIAAPRKGAKEWRMQWNPFSQCSWPPEDELIEELSLARVRPGQASAWGDLARTEKFTTSVEDGIDIRETLRHWYDGDIYVKVLPPARGTLDCVVMLFDSPADPRDYPWRTTWYAEHEEESTLAFFATDFRKEMVGPGIAWRRTAGRCSSIPRWRFPTSGPTRLDFTETLEERLLAGACLHSRCRHIALLSHYPPGAGWRRLASSTARSGSMCRWGASSATPPSSNCGWRTSSTAAKENLSAAYAARLHSQTWRDRDEFRRRETIVTHETAGAKPHFKRSKTGDPVRGDSPIAATAILQTCFRVADRGRQGASACRTRRADGRTVAWHMVEAEDVILNAAFCISAR
jgi:hypothetical protein